ncbi:Tex family protein [Flammeovirga agarivorans]|uniref:RNA-binding transcriptional accessory protein n=1 Tax=Flammeovirga agarivorans TaxID=2726742 RepID=A0A7X8SJC6_9BACT|nr:Tex family protein [Flammeovirga agarivorans]NLR91240.1 RNA-binding transcriptional accessory protein [Flammeovirga agarivorans]
MVNITQKIAQLLSISEKQVSATLELLDDGATVPFISRYRKEVTGSLDEVQVAEIRDKAQQLRELEKRKESILKSIEDQGKLTDALKNKILATETMSVLEDLYLPYKPKRKTRASIAKERGLEPLADTIASPDLSTDIVEEAKKYIDPEKDVTDVEKALAGARDIIAERLNEDQETRAEMRKLFMKKGSFKAKVIPGKENEGAKYKDYFDWTENVEKAPSHRVLAMRRAEKEMIISLDCSPEEEDALFLLEDLHVDQRTPSADQIQLAVKDAYKRLLKPSMETESRLASKKNADEEAIGVFAENLRQLLLAAPLGQKRVLALDPGFRTGCKVVCLDRQGKLLEDAVIYPNEPQRKVAESAALISHLVAKHNIEAIAVGNGTASRETESFARNLGLSGVQIVVVNESGASIYSASETARDEFPDKDVTVRGAVSIGRRLMDPLAELVKIDPKSIGVGQYQHDVDQTALKGSLDDVVMSCVNAVGVEVNTASKELLSYVSGLGPSIAKNIVDFRNENGAFTSRAQLKKVPRLGPKAFEQCAGFLRIRDAKNPLDSSAVHPESYDIVKKMAENLGVTVKELMADENFHKQIKLEDYVTDTVGLPTLTDILKELGKPGRDPREKFEAFQFQEGVEKISDLSIGMKLPGIVTNITNFGAFVDIGVHQDGLVHLSQMADRYISDPNEVVKVHQKVQVVVTDVDIARKRIALSMKGMDGNSSAPKGSKGKPNTNKRPSSQRQNKREENDENMSMADKLAMLQNRFK